MLEIIIPEKEQWDERLEVFVHSDKKVLHLEHSLVSISKWEAKWKKPFISNKEMQVEELRDYIKCMTLTQNVNPEVYDNLTPENFSAVTEYINDSMTATWFTENNKHRNNGQAITSELIYSWMVNLQIPFECQKWHLNRLMTLIRVCNESHEDPSKNKMSTRDILNRNRALNEARKAKYHTRG